MERDVNTKGTTRIQTALAKRFPTGVNGPPGILKTFWGQQKILVRYAFTAIQNCSHGKRGSTALGNHSQGEGSFFVTFSNNCGW